MGLHGLAFCTNVLSDACLSLSLPLGLMQMCWCCVSHGVCGDCTEHVLGMTLLLVLSAAGESPWPLRLQLWL